MIHQTTLAYVNLFAVLGALGELVRLDDKAQHLLRRTKPTRLGIEVKGGPAATLIFENSTCQMVEGVDSCHIKLAFSSAEKFNGMINGTVTPVPRKGAPFRRAITIHVSVISIFIPRARSARMMGF